MVTKHGDNVTGKRTKLYQVWLGMRARCSDPNHVSYKNYGARGIVVDERWNDYWDFREWSYDNGYVDPGPKRSSLEIDRIDNNGPYSPENCQWIDRSLNRRKQSHHKRWGAFGESKTLKEWSEDERCQTSYTNLRNRLTRGWETERAIATPSNPTGVWHSERIPHNKGKKLTPSGKYQTGDNT